MKKAFENSCARGCMVYVVSLVAIVVLTAVGLGGLKAGVGEGAQADGNSGVSALTVSREPAPAALVPQGDSEPAQPISEAPTPTTPPLIVLPTAPAVQITLPEVPQAFQPQGGITGEVLAPFYIVQPGDTLWEIGLEMGLDVDALRATNDVVDNIIVPGQLLYLPDGAPGVQSVPPPAAPAAPIPSAPQQPAPAESQMPNMPNTGIMNGRP